jgi:hypothetical protein
MSLTLTIPVWPGSSSFASGLTAFGFFDSETEFTSSAVKVADWCARRLGYPFNDIELQAQHFYTCFEEAVLEYSNQVNQFQIRDNLFLLQGAATGGDLTGKPINPTLNRVVSIAKNYGTEAGSGGTVTWKSASISVKEGQQTYNLSDFTYQTASDASKSIEIKRVFHDTPPAIVRYFDPFIGTGLGSQTLLENFGWGNYSPGVSFLMMPVYADLLRLQAIEFNDLVRKSGFSWEISNNKIKVFPVPTYDYTMYIEYITEEERAENTKKFAGLSVIGDFSNAPYQLHAYSGINPSGRQWIYKYTLALAKEVLGNIRNKYTSVPIPGSEITLNGADLVSQGQTEKDNLITQLRENLEAVSRSAQMTKMNTEAEDMQSQLNKIPMKIYIG